MRITKSGCIGIIVAPRYWLYNKRMHRAHHDRRFLIFGIFGLAGLAVFAAKFAPISFQIIALFLLIFFLSVLCIAHYLINNVRRSIFISAGFTILLALRAVNLRDPLYIMLLLACLISLELLFRKR